MQYRTFGRTGWSVSEIGYGMWGMAGWTGSDDDETRPRSSGRSSSAATSSTRRGPTATATASGCSATWCTTTPSSALYVATKVPPKNLKWPSRRGFTLDECFPPDHIREYAEKSLQNLALTRIDLLQFHVWEDAWAHDERWQRAVEDLQAPGTGARRRGQRESMGADQRGRDVADRSDRRRAGHLQHLRPVAARTSSSRSAASWTSP